MIGLATASMLDSNAVIDREQARVAYRDAIRKIRNLRRWVLVADYPAGEENPCFGVGAPIFANKGIANSIPEELDASSFWSLEKS